MNMLGPRSTPPHPALPASLQINQNVLPLSTCQEEWGSPDPAWQDQNFAEQSVLNTFWNNSMMCAATNYPAGPGGFCMGDSGGPLVVPGDSAAEDVQIGIVSVVQGNCQGPGEAVLAARAPTYPAHASQRQRQRPLCVACHSHAWLAPHAGVYTDIAMVWPWINATLF